MWQHRRGRRGGSGDVYAYMVAFQAVVQFMQQHRTPPVTLALIAANVAVYFRPGFLDEILPTIRQVCLNPSLVFQTGDLRRLVLSAFFHADDTHLIYNMVSLLWKGMELEGQLGSRRFAYTTAALLLLSHSYLVLSSLLLSHAFDIHEPFYRECAVGFSAVLFGMKTILNASQPTYSSVGGMLLPTKYATWAELLLIQLIVPNASFLGHLCGILSGLTLLYVPPLLGSTASALSLCSVSLGALWGRQRFFGHGQSGRREQPRHRSHATNAHSPGITPNPHTPNAHTPNVHFPSGAGITRRSCNTANQSYNSSQGDIWACPVCTYHSNAEAIHCSMCGAERRQLIDPMERPTDVDPSAPPLPEVDLHSVRGFSELASQHESGPQRPNHNQQPSSEELRAIRLARFNRR